MGPVSQSSIFRNKFEVDFNLYSSVWLGKALRRLKIWVLGGILSVCYRLSCAKRAIAKGLRSMCARQEITTRDERAESVGPKSWLPSETGISRMRELQNLSLARSLHASRSYFY